MQFEKSGAVPSPPRSPLARQAFSQNLRRRAGTIIDAPKKRVFNPKIGK